MAQGFVKNLNLLESATQSSDRSILDNLGGENITADVLLFDGNSKFQSKLVNDVNFLTGIEILYGNLDNTKKYKILDLGENRNWASVGVNVTPAVGVIFNASASGQANINTGSGGIVREVVVRQDFQQVVDVDDGFTIEVIGNNKVAFSDGTDLSVNDGTDFTLTVTNSNGEDRFQLVQKGTSTIVNLATTVGDINNASLTRSDTITATNLSNLNPSGLVTNDSEGQFSLDPESTGSDDGQPTTTSFQTFDQIGYIGQVVSKIKFKKSRIPLTYQTSIFDEKVRFKGQVRIVNSDILAIGYDQSVATTTGIVAGQQYKITDKGDTADAYWNQLAGTSNQTYNTNDLITVVNVAAAPQTTGRIKPTDPPGLFIYNEANNTEVRAFSGTDNPWNEDNSPPAFIPGVGNDDALQTASNVAQVSRLNFAPSTNDIPHFVKTNTAQSSSVDSIVTENNDLSTYTHKLPVEVDGESFFFLLKQS